MWKASVPLFRQSLAEGSSGGTQDLWQRQEMLVAVLHAAGCETCDAVEQALRAGEAEWRREHVGLVVVRMRDGGVGTGGDDATITVEDSLFESFVSLEVTSKTPCVAIADRFGRLYAAVRVHASPTADVIREAREWIDFVQEQCEECGAPVEWGI